MKKNVTKLVVILLALLLTGLARLPVEQRLAGELREKGLIQAPIDLDTRDKLGQTTYAVALGGLRSLVAALLNIRAHVHFENQEWFKLEETYRTITALQPRTRYYWEVGSWHLAYNAYADYGDRPDIPEARRRLLQKDFLAKGRAMLEEGIENNPRDWQLQHALARLLNDPFKPQDLPASCAALDKARSLPGGRKNMLDRAYLQTLCRIPDRRAEAWDTAREIWAEPENRGLPSTQSVFFALQWAHVAPGERLSIEEIYDTRPKALRNLGWYWKRRREGFPMDGVRETLDMLIKEFRIPDEYNPLLNDDWRGFPSPNP